MNNIFTVSIYIDLNKEENEFLFVVLNSFKFSYTIINILINNNTN